MNKLNFLLNKNKTLIMILIVCLISAILQGNSSFFYGSHMIKTTLFAIITFLFLGYLYYLSVTDKLNEENAVFMITLAGVLLRAFYIIFTGVYDRQHDGGAFSSLSDDFVNAGHLGYIEYFCKFGHLPNFSPYKLFSYYHPPLHHIISAVFIKLNLLFGVKEALAFENVQILTLAYSSFCIPISYKIFKKINMSGKHILLSLALIAFHPGMIYMSGSINNDMFATMLTFLCFYFSLNWINNKTLPNLLKIGLSLGFGMITKLNTAVMAFPLAAIFLYHLMKEKKSGNFIRCIKNYIIFGIITAGIGLSWVLRNLIFYRTNPGVPVLTEESVLYIGRYTYLDIFGIPSDFVIRYPFHTINGKQICNAWLILFRTSIFAEIRPTDLSEVLMITCRMALILTMLLGVICAILTVIVEINEIKKGDKELGIFLLTGYISVVITFIAFIIKYPYTCSCDFRYVVISILFTAITLYQVNSKKLSNRVLNLSIGVINFGIISILFLTTTILLFWNQW